MSGFLAGAVARAARLVTGANARVTGPEPFSGPAVYFANHASHLDFLAIWSPRSGGGSPQAFSAPCSSTGGRPRSPSARASSSR
jgi:1-acyl-sn-glycerol-3-phosphate acyltransferase